MSLPEVKCNVNTCAYWVPGDLCRAGVIRVDDGVVGAVPAGGNGSRCATFVNGRGVGDFLTTLTNTNWPGLIQEPFRSGWQMSPRVACSVRNCLYWREAAPEQRGEVASPGGCGAGSIQVNGSGATLDAETDCATFIPRS